ncbi:MAG TPA: ornithine cyclodeaminase family protein [Actinomycetota bacterium]|nr:ornithine cyclodeaminase family protein [Actinomycetota bacterium]
MEILVVNQREVPELLRMEECIDVMAEALAGLARGDSVMPLRGMARLPDQAGLLAWMPSILPTAGVMGIKVISVFPGNEGTELESHQGGVLLFEAERGRLLAVIDASEVTAIRTAAVSGVATRLLARADAGDLAILGSGTQARTNLEAMLAVRDIERVRVWSRNRAHAEAFAETESRRHGISVEVSGGGREAVEGAGIVCTTTSATEPILQGQWLSVGAHVNAVGFSGPAGRELDTEAVLRSRLFADRRESILNEAGDFLIPKGEGVVGDDHVIGELGEVILGKVVGRTSPEEITLFESLGLAIEDLAAANHIYHRAAETGQGTRVELGGERHESS